MQWPRQMSEAPPGVRSPVHPTSGPHLPWRLHEPLRPSRGGVAGLQAKRGCPGAARRPRGREGGARQALVPAAPAGSAAAPDAPPAPPLHACERLEEPARERTASYFVPCPAARTAQPALGRLLRNRVESGGSSHPLLRPAPSPQPRSAASRGSFARGGEGAGRRKGGGGGRGRVVE